MRHQNSVRQLGRTHTHRKAMFRNMVTALFRHERIVTTKAKGKELKRISERLITRAKRNADLPTDDTAARLHNKREVMKIIKDREVVKKLFDEIAPRFKDRKGGYTRLILLGKRKGDASEMSIVELVEKGAVKTKTKRTGKEHKADGETEKEDKTKKEKKWFFQKLKKE